MPFAGYKDMQDCIRKNKDKRDPKAYCASIMRTAEAAHTATNEPKEDASETPPRQRTGWWKGHL